MPLTQSLPITGVSIRGDSIVNGKYSVSVVGK
jgi:hypothetical protein